MYRNQVKFACPKPYPPTDLEDLDPRSCLAFTVEEAHAEIAKINIECASLSREIKPAQAFLDSAFKRLAALNKQRHTLDLFIFQDKLQKLPQGFAGLHVPDSIQTPEGLTDWISTLGPLELGAFKKYLSERKE